MATGSLDDFVLGGFNIGRVGDFVETFDYLNLFEGGINPFFILPAQEPCMQDETSADFCSGCRWLEGYMEAYSYKLEREAYKTGNVFFNSSLATATHSLHAPSMIVVLRFLISSSENEIHFWRSPTYNLWWILQYNIYFPLFAFTINNSNYLLEIALRFILSLRTVELVTQ